MIQSFVINANINIFIYIKKKFDSDTSNDEESIIRIFYYVRD